MSRCSLSGWHFPHSLFPPLFPPHTYRQTFLLPCLSPLFSTMSYADIWGLSGTFLQCKSHTLLPFPCLAFMLLFVETHMAGVLLKSVEESQQMLQVRLWNACPAASTVFEDRCLCHPWCLNLIPAYLHCPLFYWLHIIWKAGVAAKCLCAQCRCLMELPCSSCSTLMSWVYSCVWHMEHTCLTL